ncbi:efflux RND transporter periplasmic adaptor subunit [Hydrogenimonas thermophila]|uniref:RND family efflux transporter, MFP subunit n=1 Tax=Hydrogenimonas thermophila TaxID=223786 RepID=A0A1I5QSX0_9BACT|nr:efflux RND transporter periplasmic adaptor subunit [Hydrogenimonas thermophila]SFP49359.1 RND family efflux transporter, MFP subunit [Hydrogenimonas thermophila]
MKKIALLITLFAAILSAADLTLTGSVVSDNQKMMTSRYMGFVKKVYVVEGERVKKGQLLYTIDSKEIDSAKSQVELAISQAELALQMNRNQYNNILTNLARHERLFKKGMVSKYELENLQLAAENTKAMIEIAKKQVEQAKAKLKEVLNQYKYLDVRAPNSGVVVEKRINAGEMAIPGMPAIILTDLSSLKIMTEISESNLKDVKVGQKVKVSIPSIGYEKEGEVYAIIPSSNPMTHQFRIKVSFDYKGYRVYPGMYAQVTISK